MRSSSTTELVTSDGLEVLAKQKSAGQWDSLIATPADLDAAAIAARAGTALDDIAEVGGIARGIALDGPPSVLYAAPGEGDGA